MRYIHKSMEDRLNRELSLPATGHEQDWDVELADADRVEEFVAEFHHSERNDDRDFALVSLIVASFDEEVSGRLNQLDGEYFEIFEQFENEKERTYTPEELALWGEIKEILDANFPLYEQIIRYWSLSDDDGDPFASTLLYKHEFAERFGQ